MSFFKTNKNCLLLCYCSEAKSYFYINRENSDISFCFGIHDVKKKEGEFMIHFLLKHT